VVAAAFVTTLCAVRVSFRVLDLVTGFGVIVSPSSSIKTDVEVKVTSGAKIEMVSVAFCVVALITSDAKIEIVCVILISVVDVTSDAVGEALATSVLIEVEEKAVTTGRLPDKVLAKDTMEDDGVEVEPRDDETELHI
jgi:hypothetical protein